MSKLPFCSVTQISIACRGGMTPLAVKFNRSLRAAFLQDFLAENDTAEILEEQLDPCEQCRCWFCFGDQFRSWHQAALPWPELLHIHHDLGFGAQCLQPSTQVGGLIRYGVMFRGGGFSSVFPSQPILCHFCLSVFPSLQQIPEVISSREERLILAHSLGDFSPGGPCCFGPGRRPHWGRETVAGPSCSPCGGEAKVKKSPGARGSGSLGGRPFCEQSAPIRPCLSKLPPAGDPGFNAGS